MRMLRHVCVTLSRALYTVSRVYWHRTIRIWLGIETGPFQACHGHSGSVLGFGGNKPVNDMYLRVLAS